MIVSLGTDIVEISRVEAALERTPKLAARILDETEFVQFQAQRFPARFLAKRFAVKEAVAKALGTGIGRGVSWHHIHVERSGSGKPELRLSGGAKAVADQLGVSHWHLSYSDEREYVVAQVIAEARS